MNFRQLPCNLEAEQAILGILLYDNRAIERLDGVEARHFYEPMHALLWDAIAGEIRAGRPTDEIALHARFATDKRFEEMGGLNYLRDLVDQAPPAAILAGYGNSLLEAATRRDIIHAARRAIEGAEDMSSDLREVVTGVEASIVDIARGSEPSEVNLVDASTAAYQALDEMRQEAKTGKPKGLMTGLRCIDYRLRGLRPGAQIVIAGRPSMGKSGLARQIFHGAARRNPDYLFPFFCLEMHRREMTERTLSELTFRDQRPIQYRDMDPERFSPHDWDVMERAARQVPANFILDDTADLTVDYVRRRSWALRRKGKIGAIGIDYLQIMRRPSSGGRNDAAVIGEMTASLKRLARELDCAVVLLSQLSRGVEQRDDKRPMLSDLRESGSIEQDANVVLFPYREAYYLERREPKPGTKEHGAWQDEVEILKRKMDVICAKNRGGSIGTDIQVYHAEFDAVTDVRD